MKKLFSLIAVLLFLLTPTQIDAQTWPYAPMTSIAAATVTTKVTTITPISVTNIATYAIFTVDTSLVLRATINSGVKAGALLYIKVINGGTGATRTVTGSTGVTMVSTSLTSAKSHLFTFMYDGTNYINLAMVLLN